MRLPVDSRVGSLIKGLSIFLIASALGLEVGNLYWWINSGSPIQGLSVVFAIERFALVCHGIEGAIAAFYAPAHDKSPLKYSFYTFFVGTIGLIELFNRQEA